MNRCWGTIAERTKNTAHGAAGTQKQNIGSSQPPPQVHFKVTSQATSVGRVATDTPLIITPQGVDGFGVNSIFGMNFGQCEGFAFERGSHIQPDATTCKKFIDHTIKVTCLDQHLLIVDVMPTAIGKRAVNFRRLAVLDGIAQYGEPPHVVLQVQGVETNR